MSKKKILLLTIIILSVFVLTPGLESSNQFNNKLDINPISSDAGEPDTSRMNYIHFIRNRGEAYVRWIFEGSIFDLTDDYEWNPGLERFDNLEDITNGEYSVSIDYIGIQAYPEGSNVADIVNVNTGIGFGDNAMHTIYFDKTQSLDTHHQYVTNPASGLSNEYVIFTTSGYSDYYVKNSETPTKHFNDHGSLVDYYDFALQMLYGTSEFLYDRYDTSGEINTIRRYWDGYSFGGGSWHYFIGVTCYTAYTYSLYLDLAIDSEYYNLDNIKVECYFAKPSGTPSLNPFQNSFVNTAERDWFSFDPRNIVLECPQYKLRIRDLSDNIIYEDADYVNYAKTRSVSIPSLRFKNNYPQPIDIEYTTDSTNKTIRVNPFEYKLAVDEDSGTMEYSVYDIYGNILQIGATTNTDIICSPNETKIFIISLFDESGFGVSTDNVRIYYDNIRTNGFLETLDGIHNIKILDYFNTSLFNQNIDVSNYTEFNVYLPIYTLIIHNNYSQQMRMVIEREGISFAVVDQVIPALSSYQFRFAANLDYIISMIYLNGTYADNKTINLASNVQIESFGYYSLADITQIDNTFSGSEIGLIIAVIAGLGFISIQSLRKPKVYKTDSPIPIPRRRDNNPKNRRLR